GVRRYSGWSPKLCCGRSPDRATSAGSGDPRTTSAAGDSTLRGVLHAVRSYPHRARRLFLPGLDVHRRNGFPRWPSCRSAVPRIGRQHFTDAGPPDRPSNFGRGSSVESSEAKLDCSSRLVTRLTLRTIALG